ncbi:hypothetical protein AX15_003716 [Amanita polypyramis BW_CC]|nr:hypothetical protein AX15_003716 [Amanita polypyramis BW_CC]
MSSSTPEKTMRKRMEEFVWSLQEEIVVALEALDPNAPPFKRDKWVRAQGGAGKSCVFASPFEQGPDGALQQQRTILEKAGVNVSVVHGILPPAAIKQMRADHASMPLPDRPEGLPFFAAGISLVIHPHNPHAPTVHANYRYFEITQSPDNSSPSGTEPEILAWWFGGGSDLTPSYLYEEDAIHFHSTLKKACDAHGSQIYPSFKKWCDEYFHITHRGEARGIGGIFFDDLNEGEHKRIDPIDSSINSRPRTTEEIFVFVQEAGKAFLPSYLPILSRCHSMPYTDPHRRWQLIRRGRYVEFNLVVDRGTKFGLTTPGARIESILMSLPELARWEYMSELGQDEASEEGKLLKVLREPREWV